jgi:hypothetical protein
MTSHAQPIYLVHMLLGRVVAFSGAVIVAVGATALFDLAAPTTETFPSATHKTCSTSGTGGMLPIAQEIAPSGVLGTGTADLQGFANRYNEIRIANCLITVPTTNFRHSSCIEERLIWIAEDPSEDPLSAWGHDGTQRSDGEPAVGCDGNLAGGLNTTGGLAAQKWWFSTPHRESLYRPLYGGPMDNVCVEFAMSHGGLPDEPANFNRAGASWSDCEPYLDQVERGVTS